MIIFLDSDGTIVQSISGNVGRGSSIDQVYAIAPIATATAYISFELPNGDYTDEDLMTSYSAEVLHNTSELPEGVLNVWAPGGTINFWATKLNAAVTKYSGTVKYTIRFVHTSGEVLVSSQGSFQVARGVPTLPSTPDANVYAKIQQLLEAALAGNTELSARIDKNATDIDDLKSRVIRIETSSGGGNSGGSGTSVLVGEGNPNLVGVNGKDGYIYIDQLTTDLYKFYNGVWNKTLTMSDGAFIVGYGAPNESTLKESDVYLDTYSLNIYAYQGGSFRTAATLAGAVSKNDVINPATFDWGSWLGTSPWYSASGSAVGLFSFAAGCQPKLDGVTFTEPLFLFVNAHDYSSSKGIYFSTIANGTFYSCNVPCISSTISVPSVLEFTSGSGGGDKYIQIADTTTFDWAGAIKSALGVNYFPSDSSQILTGEMFLNFPTFTTYVGAMGEYFTRVRVDITAVYMGMGQTDVTMTAIYKGKPYTCVISSDSSGEFNLARPQLYFNEPT